MVFLLEEQSGLEKQTWKTTGFRGGQQVKKPPKRVLGEKKFKGNICDPLCLAVA